uniref:non-specific serine/threonine protein kinase n=1 Tax=Schlesneria paludicola TaxID=360056 RepID=A0A7C2NT94_9PLAN
MTAVPADDLSIAQRVDACCDQFEEQFTSGQRPRLEDILQNADESLRLQLFRGLLELDLELRRRAGDLPQRDEYVRRFPDYAAVIELVFADVAAGVSRRLQAKSEAAASSVKTSAADTSRGPVAGPMESTPDVPTAIGRFQILQLLGEGAFGAVYRARDPQLDRDVAIKVPRSGTLNTQEERDRFLREARAAAGLHQPHICPVHEVGTTTDGRDYIVMAFIDGKPLSKILQSGQKLSQRQVAGAIRKLALALDEAHQKGVIHRDLKPANIMINRKGEPVIMDFGLARRESTADPQLSHSGQIMGTPAYMSPEQARGESKKLGPATDIYSLGVVMYEMLCGQRPFQGTVTEVIGQILHVDVPPPSKFREGIDPRLQTICLKMLAKNPTERYASMQALAAALLEYQRSGPAAQPTTSATTAEPLEADEPLHTKQLAKLVAAVSSDVESKINRAADRAVRRVTKKKGNGRQAPPFWAYLAGSGLIGVIVLLGILFLIRKDTVTVIVSIPMDIQDPSLSFVLDNETVTAAELASPIELKPGEHELVVNKDDKLFKRFLFNVGKADNQPVVVQDVTPPADRSPSPPTRPRLVEVRELNASGYNTAPWLSVDGRTIYWEGRKPDASNDIEPWIWSARRLDAQSPFTNPKAEFPGRHPTVAGDQLEMLFVRGMPGNSSIRSATRKQVGDAWELHGEVPEFAGLVNAKSPALSEDGLSVVFERGRGEEVQFVVSTRANRTAPWSTPQRLPMQSDPTRTEPLTWPFLSRDGLSLWYCHGGAKSPEIRTATRPDRSSPFGNHQPVIVAGKPLNGRAPRFVAATGELFHSLNVSEQTNDWALWVAKEYRTAEPPGQPAGDLARWQGRWRAVAENVLGRDATPDEVASRNHIMEISGNARIVERILYGAQRPYRGTIRLNPDASPKEFDFHPDGTNAAGGQRGVYEFDGPRLRLIYRSSTTDIPPRATWSDKGQPNVVWFEFERVDGDWTPLFNGKDLSNWIGVDGQPARWKVENGYVEVVPQQPPVSIMTRENFPLDFELHVEFWLPDERPKTGQRSNSGVFLHGRHEIQICDSFNNDTIANPKAVCASLYDVIAPSDNACTPPETWQTYDITYHSPRVDGQKKFTTPGRITLIHNGRKVIDDASFTSPGTIGQQNANVGQPGPILLQDHGSKVRFRNVRYRPIAALRDPDRTTAEWLQKLGTTGTLRVVGAADDIEFGKTDALPDKPFHLVQVNLFVPANLSQDEVFAHLAPLRHVRSLSLDCHVNPKIQAFNFLDHWSTLKVFHLNGKMRDDNVDRLLKSCPDLERLQLANYEHEVGILEKLAALKRLKTLIFFYSKLDSGDFERIKNLPNLTYVHFGFCDDADEAIDDLKSARPGLTVTRDR